MVARQLVAVGCIVAGMWLLAVAVVDSDWLAGAVALIAVMVGVYQLGRPR